MLPIFDSPRTQMNYNCKAKSFNVLACLHFKCYYFFSFTFTTVIELQFPTTFPTILHYIYSTQPAHFSPSLESDKPQKYLISKRCSHSILMSSKNVSAHCHTAEGER